MGSKVVAYHFCVRCSLLNLNINSVMESEDDTVSTKFIVAFDFVLVEHLHVLHLRVVPR